MKWTKRIRSVLDFLGSAPGRIDRLEELQSEAAKTNTRQQQEIDALRERLRQAEETLRFVSEASPAYVQLFAEHFAGHTPANEILNRSLSTHKTLWGEEARLHISPKADVQSCFFNTNSGFITIGDYTFAGSRVSILAGTHDFRLTGLPRRDADLTEGCDITIGKGVWLASGCTLLGPCAVGDNAVIAAGAVVTPGTTVPANTIYGGVPAREIGRLEADKGNFRENPALQSALSRQKGLLYGEGWSSKKNDVTDFIGHWLAESEGILFADQPDWMLSFFLEDAAEGLLRFRCDRGETVCRLSGPAGKVPVSFPCANGQVEIIRVVLEAEGGRLFASFQKPEA